MLRMGLAPCSPFTVTNDLMIAAAEIARRHPGVRLHTHLAENQEDVDYSLKVYGVRPGEYLKCGPDPRTTLAGFQALVGAQALTGA